jgi:hypothetical protein
MPLITQKEFHKAFVYQSVCLKLKLLPSRNTHRLLTTTIYDTVRNLLFDSDVEYPNNTSISEFTALRENAVKVFEYNNIDDIFKIVAVKTVLRMNIIVKLVAVRISFNQASLLHQSEKKEIGTWVICSSSVTYIAQQCCLVGTIKILFHTGVHIWMRYIHSMFTQLLPSYTKNAQTFT